MKNLFLIAMVLFTSCATLPRITYEGERNQEEKYHGKGVYTHKNGKSMCGDWKENKPSEEGMMTYWESYPCDPKVDSCLVRNKGGKVYKVYGDSFKRFLLETDNNTFEKRL